MSVSRDEWVSRSEGGEELPDGPLDEYEDYGLVIFDTSDPSIFIESTVFHAPEEVE